MALTGGVRNENILYEINTRGKSGNGNSINLICHYCGSSITFEEATLQGWRTECKICKSNMHVKYDYDRRSTRSQARSAIEALSSESFSLPLLLQIPSLLPVREEAITSVFENLLKSHVGIPGSTQLKPSNRHPNLFLKCEFRNPTGSFKDVGTICEFSKAYELGLVSDEFTDLSNKSSPDGRSLDFTGLHLASTGNMGISTTYYANALRVPLVLHISKTVDKAKLQRMKKYGLEAPNLLVRRCVECSEKMGGYDAQQEHVRMKFENTSPGSRMWIGDTTLRIEGCKTIGYEIYAQLGRRVPDNVIIPVGNGTLLCAVWKAFDELRRMELTRETPRIYGVVVPENLHSKVSALGVSRPGDLTAAFKIIRDSGGALLSVDESVVNQGQESLFLEEDAIKAEAAGALSYASYETIVGSSSSSRARETTVALITGAECN